MPRLRNLLAEEIEKSISDSKKRVQHKSFFSGNSQKLPLE
jgi:hypothetical protein